MKFVLKVKRNIVNIFSQHFSRNKKELKKSHKFNETKTNLNQFDKIFHIFFSEIF